MDLRKRDESKWLRIIIGLLKGRETQTQLVQPLEPFVAISSVLDEGDWEEAPPFQEHKIEMVPQT